MTLGRPLQSHCCKGHPLEGENLRVRMRKNGHTKRTCMECERERKVKSRAGIGRIRPAWCREKEGDPWVERWVIR